MDIPTLLYLRIPPILSLDYYENKNRLVRILSDYSDTYTDDDGYIWIALMVGQGKIGTYILSLEFGTIFN